ncbi:probable endonuclease 4 isoform X2 [Artemia franciscana]
MSLIFCGQVVELCQIFYEPEWSKRKKAMFGKAMLRTIIIKTFDVVATKSSLIGKEGSVTAMPRKATKKVTKNIEANGENDEEVLSTKEHHVTRNARKRRTITVDVKENFDMSVQPKEEIVLSQTVNKVGEHVPAKKTRKKNVKEIAETEIRDDSTKIVKKGKNVLKKEEIDEEKIKVETELEKTPEKKLKKRKVTKAQLHQDVVRKLDKVMYKQDYKFPMQYIPRSKVINGFNGSVSSTGQMFVGAHVSAQGGLAEAVFNAAEIGARSFALFLRSQRQWLAKPMEQKIIDDFKAVREEFGYPPHLILPHGSYLLNLGSSKLENLQKSRELLLDEIMRCEALGLTHYNFHPGSTCGECTITECLKNIADSINYVHERTYPSKVMTVIENMSKQGNTVGGFLHEIGEIIQLVKDKERVGVCIDTCHAFAAGYDLATDEGFQSLLNDIEKDIGFEYIVAMHLNDSKFPVGSHKDRHENIGKGHIGKEGFRRIMNCKKFSDIPIILETPWDESKTCPYSKEIDLLYSLQDS